jgi:hypothetical protein
MIGWDRIRIRVGIKIRPKYYLVRNMTTVQPRTKRMEIDRPLQIDKKGKDYKNA